MGSEISSSQQFKGGLSVELDPPAVRLCMIRVTCHVAGRLVKGLFKRPILKDTFTKRQATCLSNTRDSR